MRRRRLLVYVDLVQDIDVLLPVLLALRAAPEWRLTVCVSHWLARASPRTAKILRGHEVPFRYVLRRAVIAGRSPMFLSGFDALLTASESSSDTHRAGWILAQRMRAAGAITFTLQHGLKNVGLEPGEDGVFAAFASHHVLCWSEGALSAPGLPEVTRAKLICVGRPALAPPARAPVYDLAVFENLHAREYGADERAAFLAGLHAVIASNVAARIYIRSHPAGGWLEAQRHALPQRSGVTFESRLAVLAEQTSGREAPLLGARSITTPSTVALDAAVVGRPVAVAGRRDPRYSPLPHLQTVEDWLAFAARAPDPAPAIAFRARVLAAGDAASRVVAVLAGRVSS